MGQDLEYICGTQHFEWRISRSDWDVLQAIREHLPAEIETLFEVPELGDEVSVQVERAREAAGRLTTFLADNPGALPRTFQFKSNLTGWSTGGQSGFQLPNEPDLWYMIEAGSNLCRLSWMRTRPDGRGEFVGERDIRGTNEIQTTNMGTIHIRSRAARCELRPVLKKILAFLESADGEEFVKTVG